MSCHPCRSDRREAEEALLMQVGLFPRRLGPPRRGLAAGAAPPQLQVGACRRGPGWIARLRPPGSSPRHHRAATPSIRTSATPSLGAHRAAAHRAARPLRTRTVRAAETALPEERWDLDLRPRLRTRAGHPPAG